MSSQTEKKALPVHVLANRFLDRAPVIFTDPLSAFHNPKYTWLYVLEEDLIYIYEPHEGTYRPLTMNDDLKNALYHFLKHEQDQVLGTSTDTSGGGIKTKPLHPDMAFTPNLINDLETTIKDSALSKKQRLPTRENNSFITFQDLKVMDLRDPTAPLLTASPSIPSFQYLPFPSDTFSLPFNGPTECPRFMQFLNEVLVLENTAWLDIPSPDPELIDLVQEAFGYTLFSDSPSQTAFFLYGTGQNGKSVLLKALSALFPPHSISAVKISDLSRSNFMSASLIGKKLNIVHEEESRDMNIDTLKNLISGEPMTIERKYKTSLLYAPKIKFFFGTNEVPNFERMDPALKRRLVIIPFFRQIPDHLRDNFLFDYLIKNELPGIFHFALEGAKRLQANNFKFTKAKAVNTISEQVELERFPALQFFHAFYQITGDLTDYVSNKVMYQDYRSWCEENGFKPLNATNFGKQILLIDPKRIEGGKDGRARVQGVLVPVRRGFKRRPEVTANDTNTLSFKT